MGGSGALVVILTLVQLSSIKIDPWSAIGRGIGRLLKWIGRSLNGEVLSKLDELEKGQIETKKQLDDHIRMDDERNADLHRAYILRFNTELLRGIDHTEEDFNEILYNIDCYERYCKEHPEYQNNRAVHAIKHIKNVYDEHMEKGTFLKA